MIDLICIYLFNKLFKFTTVSEHHESFLSSLYKKLLDYLFHSVSLEVLSLTQY